MKKKRSGGLDWIGKNKESLPDEVILSYKFIVVINDLRIGFSKISNIESSIETEPLAEGGVNDHAHSLFKAVSSEKQLVMERGMFSLARPTPFKQKSLDILRVGARIGGPVIVAVFTPDNKIARLYSFYGCIIKKWSCGELDAMNGQVLVERFELSYEYMQEEKLNAADKYTVKTLM